MFKDITEDKPLVVKCQSDWVIHANDQDFDLKRAQETLKNWSQKDKRDYLQMTSCCCEKTFQSDISNNNSQQMTNKDQDNSQTEQQVQKDVRTGEVDLFLGRLTDTLGKSFDPKRTQQALKNSLEGNYIWKQKVHATQTYSDG